MSRVGKILSPFKLTPIAGLFSLFIAALVCFGLAMELDPIRGRPGRFLGLRTLVCSSTASPPMAER